MYAAIILICLLHNFFVKLVKYSHISIDDNKFFEVNDYNMILQTIRCSRMGTNYFDTIQQQYENRNILNKFLENNTSIEELVDKLKKVNGKIIDEDFLYAKNDSEEPVGNL